MKHLKIFKTESERAAYIAETPLPTYPYVHYVEETKGVEYSGAEVDIPFYFESIEGLSVKFSNKYQYSRDGVSWADGTSSTTITFNTGERVYFRATGLTASSSSGIGKFTISTGTAKIGGNLMSMLYGEDYRGKTTIEQPYAFKSLFGGCSRLKSAKRLALPATTLAVRCYDFMFQNCTSLVNAPVLPATTLAEYCYSSMFRGCTSLVNAPALPATTLAERCYEHMFRDCTSLVNAPALPATTLSGYCYNYMFWGCTSLVNAPELPATTLAERCYDCMFRGCTSLINAPALPATTLAKYCYSNMFYGCTSLVNAPELPATSLAGFCYECMFQNCTSLVNAPALPATTLATYCYNHMFRDCTSLVNAPELPATSLASFCYNYMFWCCSKLNYIKAMFKTAPGSNYTYSWVDGVAAEGTFVKNAEATWDVIGVSGIPEGWTIIKE